MKKMKKILSMLLAVVMVMGMCMTALADEVDGDTRSGNAKATQSNTVEGYPSEADTTTVTITGLTGVQEGTVVTLYKIANAYYKDKGFDYYEFAQGTGVTVENAQSGLTADQIAAIANGLKANQATIVPYKTYTTSSDVEESEVLIKKGTIAGGNVYTCSVEAGVYIAIVTGAKNAIYNPILLTATYDKDGKLAGGTINASSDYLFGSTAVAKSMTPDIEKTVTGGEADEKQNGSDKEGITTASVGTKLTYTLTPTVPEYPVNATNKALFISDKMSTGLTFLPDSLKVIVNGEGYKADENGALKKDVTDANEDPIGKITITPATSEQGASFVINLKYEKLRAEGVTGSVYNPVVTYNAVINEKAVLENENEASLIYSTEPNTTPDWDENTNVPPTGSGYDHQEDTEIVYTYELSFHKIGVEEHVEKLPGAVFGIYSDVACTKLVDVVKTNAEGYAVSNQVEKGTYYIKEIQAPSGYTLNEKVYMAEVNWSTATKSFIVTETKRTYTTNVSEAISSVQVGWLSDSNVFYEMDDQLVTTGLHAAYVATETVSTNTNKETFTNGNGTVTDIYEADENGSMKGPVVADITNTKLASLPSTGGIGTTIFTIGGCAIMIIAAALFFATRRKAEK